MLQYPTTRTTKGRLLASAVCVLDCIHQVKTLNRRVVKLMGFEKWIPVSGQTYSRKIDYQVNCIAVHV